MLEKLNAVLLILILFAPQLSLAATDASGNSGPNANAGTPDITLPSNAANYQPTIPDNSLNSNPSSCRLTALTDSEAQKLLDLRKKVNTFDELNSGTPANTQRKTLENNKALIPDAQGDLALKQEFPNKEIKLDEIAFILNLKGKGAFAFGVVLNDTLRVGTCKGDKTNPGACPVRDKGLTFKNDGTGIVTDFKSAFDFSSAFGDTKQKPISQSALDTMAIEAELQNPNPVEAKEGDLSALKDSSIQVKTASRIPGNVLNNRVEAQNFTASMGTTCQNGACVINIYSLFDKYFNSMFSANLVISNLAPTLIGKTAYLFGTAESRGWQFPFQQKISSWTKGNVSTYLKPTEVRKGTMQRFDFIQNKYDFGGLGTIDLYIDQKKGTLLSDGAFAGWKEKFFQEGAQKITTYEARRKFVDQAMDVYKYSQVNQQMKQFVMDELAAGRLTKIEAGRKMAEIAADWDSATHLNLKDWFMQNDRHGLVDAYVKPMVGGAAVDNPIKISAFNTPTYVFDDFITNGRFGAKVEADAAGALKLYKINPVGNPIATGVPFDTLEASVRAGQYANQLAAVRLNNGSFVSATADNLEYIRTNTAGTVDVFAAKITDAGILTPDEMAGRVMDLLPSRLESANRNMGKLKDILREHGWASRKYFSLLDKQMLEEQQLLKSYLGSIKGAAKWTAYPFMYSWAKKGVNFQDVSIYRLPQTWSEITFTQGTDKLYNDAFIDFFSNAGSDQGDIFTQMLNVLPWKSLVLDPLAEKTPYANIWNTISGKGFRSKSENLAFFVYGAQKKCSTCTAGIQSKDGKEGSLTFTTNENLNSFLFEYPSSTAAKKSGQTLIAYAHHTNMQGKDSSGKGNEINPVNAIADKKTCTDAVKESGLGFGYDIGAQGAAAVLGAGESLGYYLFGPVGMIGSAIQQVYFAPQFNGCIDDREGYFIHYFVPADSSKKAASSSAIAGAEKASSIIESGQKTVTDLLTNVAGQSTAKAADAKAQGLSPEELQQKQGGQGVVKNAADQIQASTDKIVNQIQDKDILEALFTTQGSASGQAFFNALFWFWIEGTDLSPTKYRTDGVTNYVDSKGNTLKSDYKEGKISLNGEVLVNEDGSRPELQRMEGLNLAIPAKEVPQRLTSMRMSGDRTLMFEMLANGEMYISDPQVRGCIETAVMEQTGVRLYSDNLAQTFGFVTSIETENSTVTPKATGIIVEGPLRFIAEGAGSKAQIFGNRDVNVIDERGLIVRAGLLSSIVFENGVMVYNTQTKELIIWLKHHKMATPSFSDVKGLKATLTTDKNPLTNCDEPAIDLSLMANKESGLSTEKVENFNAGTKLNGPFKVFETDKAIFTFYAEPPDCQPRFRMVDKATGNVTDEAIVPGSLKQTPTGIQFQTIDKAGNIKNQTMDFSAPDGKPILTYNGVPQNLLSAQGKNGSFYFNPDTGQYYSENGQFIPLNNQFKQGISPRVNPDGTVSGVPGQNIFAPQIGSGSNSNGLLNLPSMPQELLIFLLFVSAITASIVLIRIRK
ncbi:MAG: hypothetical protein Q7R70_05745 [Candidatus Diapherotrites archaeon]|nr:hypothetical protein [Candidatus Diapherotrites archaeon]